MMKINDLIVVKKGVLRFLFTPFMMLLAFGLLFLGLDANAQDEKTKIRLDGFADTYHALRSSDPYNFMSSRSRLRSELNISHGESKLYASVNSMYNALIPDQTKIELREAYFRYHSDNWELTAGRQIITWGVADGIRITDLISPMDMTEFLARDYDDIRIPVNGFRLKFTQTNFTVEAVFVPVPEFYIIPVDPVNPWSLSAGSTMPMTFDPTGTPEKKIQNSEFGGRFSGYIKGVDFSLCYLHTWNKMPVFTSAMNTASEALEFTPHYDRMDMLGLDVSVPIGQFVIRGEGAGYLNTIVQTSDGTIYTDPLTSNTLNWLVGIDWYPGCDWTITAQYSQALILDYQDAMESEKNTILSTLGITKKIFRSSCSLSTFAYVDVSNGGFFDRTSIDYAVSDDFHLLAGYDWFNGEKGMFSYYRNNSEYWVKAVYNF